jgi:hypothetical protein
MLITLATGKDYHGPTFASRPQVTIFTRSGRMGCPFVIAPHPGVGGEESPAAGSALVCLP